MVAVRMLTGVAGDDFSWRPGEIVDMSEEQAAAWADGVRGERVTPAVLTIGGHPGGVTGVLLDQVRGAVRRQRAGSGPARETTTAPAPPERTSTTGVPDGATPPDRTGMPDGPDPIHPQGTAEPVSPDPVDPEDPASSDTPTDPPGPVDPEDPSDQPGPEVPPKKGPGSGDKAWREYAAACGVDVPDDAKREQIWPLLEAAGIPTGPEPEQD